MVSHELTAYLTWLYYQKDVNLITLNHTQQSKTLHIFYAFIQILLNVNLSVESNSSDILTLRETNLDDSIDSDNFSVTCYLPLIWKDSITHMHGLAVYVKEGFPFAYDLSLQNFDLYILTYICFWLTLYTILNVLLLFCLSITFFIFIFGFWFYSI